MRQIEYVLRRRAEDQLGQRVVAVVRRAILRGSISKFASA
jgi:hypothetical protein